MSHPPKFRYLNKKLARSVFWVGSLFALLTAGACFVAEYQRSTSRTAHLLNQLLDTVENTAAIAAYANNHEIAVDVLKGLLRNDIVHRAALTGSEGLTVQQTRSQHAPPDDEHHEIVRVLHSPLGDGTRIGALTVYPETRFNLREGRVSALVSGLVAAILVALTALIVLLMVRAALARPLLTVSGALHAIRAGHQERIAALPEHEDDELGRLVHDINGLLATLEYRLKAEHALRAEIEAIGERWRQIFATSSAGIFLLDTSARLLVANATLWRVLSIGEMTIDQLNQIGFLNMTFAHPQRLRELMRKAAHGGLPVAMDLELNLPYDAEPKWVHCLLSRQSDPDGWERFEGVVYDVTERIAAAQQARHAANHDPLTGLLRRHAAEESLQDLLKYPPDRQHAQALLLLDLDGFKRINDRYGHDAGDSVLIETARRLRACVRSSDVVARLGGDEFLIILMNCTPVERAETIARQIVMQLSQPIAIDQSLTVQVGVSIGIRIYESAGQTPEQMCKQADLAMYEVKRRGKNGYGVCRSDGSIKVERPMRHSAGETNAPMA